VLKVGGVLFADNVLFRGYVGDKVKTPHRFNTTKHSMERFLSAITTNDNLSSQIIDIEDGISITEKIK
jgi:predicted O-methyltransferase YrrM